MTNPIRSVHSPFNEVDVHCAHVSPRPRLPISQFSHRSALVLVLRRIPNHYRAVHAIRTYSHLSRETKHLNRIVRADVCCRGMYKKSAKDRCEFCPAKSYSNGMLSSCLPCASDLSLVPGLYCKVWNEMPDSLTRSYMSFERTSDSRCSLFVVSHSLSLPSSF